MKFIKITVFCFLIICFALFYTASALQKKTSKSEKSLKSSSSKASQYILYRTYRYRRLCRLYNDDPYTCVTLSYCGWCQAKRICVPGSFYGPIYSTYCGPNDYYIYETPISYSGVVWDPFATTINFRWSTYYRRYRLGPSAIRTITVA